MTLTPSIQGTYSETLHGGKSLVGSWSKKEIASPSRKLVDGYQWCAISVLSKFRTVLHGQHGCTLLLAIEVSLYRALQADMERRGFWGPCLCPPFLGGRGGLLVPGEGLTLVVQKGKTEGYNRYSQESVTKRVGTSGKVKMEESSSNGNRVANRAIGPVTKKAALCRGGRQKPPRRLAGQLKKHGDINQEVCRGTGRQRRLRVTL